MIHRPRRVNTPELVATAGYPLAAGATLTLGSTGGQPHDLYGVVASGSTTVAFMFPAS
jgi:hypothetical protein